MRRVTSALGALGLILASAFFCLLPRAWAHFVGRHMGGIAYFLSARSRRTALENLRLRLGVEGPAARYIARKSMGQAGAAIMDLLRAPRVTRRIVERDIDVPPEAQALIDGLRGQPLVVASCHLGNWEFSGLCVPFLFTGAPSLVVVRPPKSPYVSRVFDALRGWTGQKVIHRASAILRAHAHLRDGGHVAMVVDVSVPPQAGAATVDFFGVPTYSTLAPGYLAARTGAALLFAYLLPLGGHRYRLVLRRIEVPRADSPRETALALTRKLSSELEAAIREHPRHWAWWLKRWIIRPDGAPGEWPSYSRHEKRHLPRGLVKDA